MPTLLLVALAAFLINLPFGFWRYGYRKFSLLWFVAVHAPVPFIAFIRIQSGIGWNLSTFPVLIGAYVAGQFLGARARHWWVQRAAADSTADA